MSEKMGQLDLDGHCLGQTVRLTSKHRSSVFEGPLTAIEYDSHATASKQQTGGHWRARQTYTSA